MPEFQTKATGERALFLALFLASVIALSIYTHNPPPLAPKDAPQEVFSAQRAFAHVKACAQAPHPSGSPENKRVRQYIEGQVKALGLRPELQRTMVNWLPGRMAMVENVVVHIPGQDSSGALCLCAHYDSVPYGPGASDDIAGVAALLESMRALKNGPPLKNDLVFVFSDGEEGRLPHAGLRGARAFVEQHPLMKEVKAVLNFDCRGNTGPAYMYESSDENGWLIQQMAKADCHPIAMSFLYDIYSRAPLASDFTPFRDAGVAGLNFAFIRGLTKYHTREDSPENLNLRSLQHHGLYAFKLSQALGNVSLAQVRAPNRVYFNLLASFFVHYPATWMLPLSGLLCVVAALVLGLGFQRGLLQPGAMLKTLLGYALICAAMLLLTGLLIALGFYRRDVYFLYSAGPFSVAMLALLIAVTALYLTRLLRNDLMLNFSGAMFVLWVLCALLVPFLSPGASYLFLWPALASALGLYLIYSASQEEELSTLRVLGLAVTALPGLLLIGPVLAAIHDGGPVLFTPVLLLTGMLLLGLLAPQLGLILAQRSWPVPVISCLVAVIALAMVALWPGFTARQPKFNCVAYGLDATKGEAYWMSSDKEADAWTRQFFGEEGAFQPASAFFPDVDKPYLTAAAPVVATSIPQMRLIKEEKTGDGRRLLLTIDSPKDAPRMVLYAMPDVQVRGAWVDGKKLMDVDERSWFMAWSIFPGEGIECALEITGNGPARFILVEHHYALPSFENTPNTTRPDEMTMKTNSVDFNLEALKSDETLVSKRYVF